MPVNHHHESTTTMRILDCRLCSHSTAALKLTGLALCFWQDHRPFIELQTQLTPYVHFNFKGGGLGAGPAAHGGGGGGGGGGPPRRGGGPGGPGV
jgi:hypothetical protein